jgi:hypothetical protein
MIRHLLACVLFLVFAASQVQAGQLLLNYSGLTDGSSSWAGLPIAPATDFDIHAVFEIPPIDVPFPDEGIYAVDAIGGQVGGTPFSAVFAPGAYVVSLVDPSAGAFGNFAVLGSIGGAGDFAPVYATTTPALDAQAAAPTVFSDYLGSFVSSLTFSTAAGDLVLDYDSTVGVGASITTVPEPGTFVMSSILVAIFGVVWSHNRLK